MISITHMYTTKDIKRSINRMERIKFLNNMLEHYERSENYEKCASTLVKINKLKNKDIRNVPN